MFESMKRGMGNTRARFREYMNELLDRGPAVDADFWDGLEEALIMADVGAPAAADIVENIRSYATRKALPDAYAVMDALADHIAETFTQTEDNLLNENPVCVLFVGINGAGKTTTVGKIAFEQKEAGRNVILGSADTFRAAAIEQLEVWGQRADVEIVQRQRGSDPASVCYDTLERAEATGADMVLIDTAGRLHTSDDLMRELEKVVNVVRKRATCPVKTVLVIDATTGQNGLNQARQFDRALSLDGLIVTKLDGTAKGGIALAVSHELGLPIVKVGVGERLEDLQDFDPHEFAAALIGAEPVEPVDDSGGTEAVPSSSHGAKAAPSAGSPLLHSPESPTGTDTSGDQVAAEAAQGFSDMPVGVVSNANPDSEQSERKNRSQNDSSVNVNESQRSARGEDMPLWHVSPSSESVAPEDISENPEAAAAADEPNAQEEGEKQEGRMKRFWRWLNE